MFACVHVCVANIPLGIQQVPSTHGVQHNDVVGLCPSISAYLESLDHWKRRKKKNTVNTIVLNECLSNILEGHFTAMEVHQQTTTSAFLTCRWNVHVASRCQRELITSPKAREELGLIKAEDLPVIWESEPVKGESIETWSDFGTQHSLDYPCWGQ